MSSDPPSAAPEFAYAIEYQIFAGRESNAEFRGPGRLAIRPNGPTYVFTGKRRALWSGPPVDREYAAAEIWNVTCSGRSVHFLARSPAGAKPFVFYCRTPDEARAVARLLPGQQDEDFLATQDFAVRLHRVPGAASPWTSVTNILIALNVAVFVLMGTQGAGWLEAASMKPYVLFGANNGGATTDGEWWRLVTCMFMHYGLIHLALNMWALFQVGHLLENLLGRTLYALAYVGSGVTASLASIIWHGDKIWSAGASGAVFGAYGALLGYMLREKHGVPKAVFQPIMRSTLTFAGYNIFYGLVHPQIDNSAHVGGLLSGLALGWLFALPLDPLARTRLYGRRLQAGLVAVALLVAGGIALTPRFDYHLADEMRWEEVIEDFSARETGLLTHQNKAWTEFSRDTKNPDAYAQWIEHELIPAYADFARQLATMPLTPGKVTFRRRDVVLASIQLRLEGYRHLLPGVRNRDGAELAAYGELEKRAAAELGRIPKPGQ